MAMQQVKVYYWDFFGPDCQETAEHFQRHMEQFLFANNILGCQTGTESTFRHHFAAFCKTPAELEGVIEKSLRPKRALWGELEPQAVSTFDV